MSRSTKTNFGGAYRVVLEKRDRETAEVVGQRDYVGPYQTKGAAKGQLTYLVAQANRTHWRTDEPPETETAGWIEQTTGEWKRIEP